MLKLILIIAFQTFLYSCDMAKHEKKIEVKETKLEDRNDSGWVRKQVYINEPSELFSYEISFIKGDSSIIYIVDSKEKEIFKPVYLNHLMIMKNKTDYIDIRFKQHNKIKEVTKNYKDLDFSNVEDVFSFSNKKTDESKQYNGTRIEGKVNIDNFLFSEFGWKKY